ncbi:carbohydrate ABC transporter permease [Gelria sp. Kuro-4]|uniref:carbohydrate ABC transporter permease n=1 Tax=Gelria sp. Kuro-4 TaxID=2796927 RepID=UPI001C80AD93|nr:sugar ABC transporter permease [Gelria sp. Kuro-4]
MVGLETSIRRKERPVLLGREPPAGRLAWRLVSPTLLVVFLVSLLPLVLAFALSFTEAHVVRGGIAWRFIGLENYRYYLGNRAFWESLRVTAFFTVVSLAVELVLGIGMALILNQPFFGRGLVRALILIPWALPTVVNARMWAWIYDGHAYGALNGLLLALGWIKEPLVWLSTAVPGAHVPVLGPFLKWVGDSTALNMILIGDTWKVTPLVALLVLAGLQTIPREYYEAARVDGATVWQQFRLITLPLLKPVILVVLVLRTMELFRVFDILYIIMANTIKVLSIYTFEEGIVFGHLGRGSALSFLVGLVILLLAFVYIKLLYSEEVR